MHAPPQQSRPAPHAASQSPPSPPDPLLVLDPPLLLDVLPLLDPLALLDAPPLLDPLPLEPELAPPELLALVPAPLELPIPELDPLVLPASSTEASPRGASTVKLPPQCAPRMTAAIVEMIFLRISLPPRLSDPASKGSPEKVDAHRDPFHGAGHRIFFRRDSCTIPGALALAIISLRCASSPYP